MRHRVLSGQGNSKMPHLNMSVLRAKDCGVQVSSSGDGGYSVLEWYGFFMRQYTMTVGYGRVYVTHGEWNSSIHISNTEFLNSKHGLLVVDALHQQKHFISEPTQSSCRGPLPTRRTEISPAIMSSSLCVSSHATKHVHEINECAHDFVHMHRRPAVSAADLTETISPGGWRLVSFCQI